MIILVIYDLEVKFKGLSPSMVLPLKQSLPACLNLPAFFSLCPPTLSSSPGPLERSSRSHNVPELKKQFDLGGDTGEMVLPPHTFRMHEGTAPPPKLINWGHKC